MAKTRRFLLVRDDDVTGVSGTGTVADGILWPDGTVAMRWRGEPRSTSIWDNLDELLAVHGHDGATSIEWVDNGGYPRHEGAFIALGPELFTDDDARVICWQGRNYVLAD